MELPPRARRILLYAAAGMGASGTTSACAENTHPQLPGGRDVWNYLRVRGEYDITTLTTPNPLELPPRARRILADWGSVLSTGELPPRARRIPGENGHAVCEPGNYLRVRGEYS